MTPLRVTSISLLSWDKKTGDSNRDTVPCSPKNPLSSPEGLASRAACKCHSPAFFSREHFPGFTDEEMEESESTPCSFDIPGEEGTVFTFIGQSLTAASRLASYPTPTDGPRPSFKAQSTPQRSAQLASYSAYNKQATAVTTTEDLVAT